MTAARRFRLLPPLLLTVCGCALALPMGGGPPPAPTVAPAILEWKATKEEGVYGYLVYRATDRDGPYRRLGHEIVRVSQEPGEIHSYRFVDTTVEASKTYFYYLDKIATTGVKSRFSGVVAKRVPPA